MTAALIEAAAFARAVLARLLSEGHNFPGPTPEDIEKAFWGLENALDGVAIGLGEADPTA